MTSSLTLVALEGTPSDVPAIRFAFSNNDSDSVFGDDICICPLYRNKATSQFEEFDSGCYVSRDSAKLLHAALGAYLDK